MSRSNLLLKDSPGLRPYREVAFSLADGTTVTRQVGDAYFEIDGSLGPAPVIFGEEGDEPLLGATTLETSAWCWIRSSGG